MGPWRLKRGGLSHGIDSVNSADYFAFGRGAGMALQPELGLSTKRRIGFGALDRDHFVVAQSVLT